MTNRIVREDFLRVLECVRPGTTPKDTSEQSSCVVFQNGYAYTFNEDVFCRTKSGLPEDWTAAVPFPPLVTILTKLGEAELGIELTGKEVILQGKGRKTGIRAEEQITMPFDAVTLPEKTGWWKAPAELGDALALVQDCAGTNAADDFSLTCIHLHPKFVEASDKKQIARHRIRTGLPSSILLRKESLSAAVTLDIKRLALTDNWFHLKTGAGSIYSVHTNEGGYLDMKPFLQKGGEKVILLGT